MGSQQLGSKLLQRSQICSHTPSALNAGAKRSEVPYGHASMLLLGEGSEATQPYNKYDKIRPHSIRSLQFDQKIRPLSFRPEKFDLFTATINPPSDRKKKFLPFFFRISTTTMFFEKGSTRKKTTISTSLEQ